ncbi:hypothetical protein FQA39_LY09971 [Lamprigera yunnana]|nr:hypothetical protein FQA39_LY09971 [Lamprigera yunnana]
MSTQYHFVDKDNSKNDIVIDSAVLVEDGIVWDNGEVQMSLNYANNDITLIENNNESYFTANADTDTQYFSVLETTNEATLSELNDFTLYTNGDNVELPDQQSVNPLIDDQNIFTIQENDDLYAFQIGYDEDGSGQRCRYYLRVNENGLLEGVPESIQLLPIEDEVVLPDLQTTESELQEPELQESELQESELPEPELEKSELRESETQQSEGENSKSTLANHDMIIKKEEYFHYHEDQLERASPDFHDEDSYHELHVNEDEDGDYFPDSPTYGEILESKPDLAEQKMLVHKIEENNYSEGSSSVFDDLCENELSSESLDSNTPSHTAEDDFEEVYRLEEDANNDNVETALPVHSPEEVLVDVPEELENVDNSKSSDSVPSLSNHKDNVEFIENFNENVSDSEEFQIVDGVHVTADETGNEDANPEIDTFVERASQEHALKLQENVSFVQNTETKSRNTFKKGNGKVNKNLMYYVIQHPEKENVESITQDPVNEKVVKANPRSVLKSSFLLFERLKEKPKPPPKKNEKKPSRSKESTQVRVLQNYIAGTTIIHAPVRQERLPRKQTIKPVTRADEEIIVQEVVVSSNGIVETTEDGVVKSKIPLKPTQFVQLTDSDEDYDSKREQKKKKKKKKRKCKVPQIVISDSEDVASDENVVEIDLSEESDQEKDKGLKGYPKGNDTTQDVGDANCSASSSENIKRKRGRPKKRLSSGLDDNTADSSTSSKKLKSLNNSENNELSSPLKLELKNNTKWKCDSCPKVFPSQGDLKTHIQFHTYREPNNRINLFTKRPSTVTKSNNYKCLICYDTFKNNYLLTKHTKEHGDSSNFQCGICKKLFSDHMQLINHKRSHVKEQMFKTTTLPKHTPKRKSIGNKLTVPKTDSKYKCIFCSKVFSSQILLNAHTRSHKYFTCSRCSANFISKLTLEHHVQHSCVKTPKSRGRRLSFKTMSLRTPLFTDSKRLSTGHNTNISSESDKEKKKFSSVNLTTLQCDSCSINFKSHTSLYKHNVLKHGLETFDKSVKQNKPKKLLHKESGKYSSLPPSERLQSVFAKLRTPK